MAQRERGNLTLRLADRYIGIPAACMTGVFHRSRPVPKDVRRIGLFMFGAIGDSLLAASLVPDLKTKYPDASVTVFCTNANRGISEILSGIDNFVTLPIGSPRQSLQTLRATPLDLLLDFGQWARINALLAQASNAKFTAGFATVGQFRHYGYDATVRHRDDIHEIENFRNLAKVVDVYSTRVPVLARNGHVTQRLELPSVPYVVFHPWASGYKSYMREWSNDNWVRLGQHIISKGFHVLISGGPADREKTDRLLVAINAPAEVSRMNASLPECVEILRRSAAVVSVNTGIMHVAAALDVPLIALHGPNNPVRWGPLSKKAIVVGPGRDEGGAYLNLGFEYPRNPTDIMSRITSDSVISKLSSVLDAHRLSDTGVHRILSAKYAGAALVSVPEAPSYGVKAGATTRALANEIPGSSLSFSYAVPIANAGSDMLSEPQRGRISYEWNLLSSFRVKNSGPT